MAGMGTRLRPFTLTTPKPFIKLAGKSILQRLIEKLIAVSKNTVTEVGFIIGNFPQNIIDDIHSLGNKYNFKVNIFYQQEALGTAHAIYQAKDMLSDEVIVAFADTLFDADFEIDNSADVIIWTKKVSNPQLYGVVVKQNDVITSFYEKPKQFISDEAIIGIYYFKNVALLHTKIENIINNNLRENNEYQLTNALQMLLDDNLLFKSQNVDEWLDCGNKDLLINTTSHLLNTNQFQTSDKIVLTDTVIIKPVFIADNVKIINSVIGPNVSIESNSTLMNVIVKNSIILSNSIIRNIVIENSMIGNNVFVNKIPKSLELGDYDKI